ncbi:MAG: glycosyltransferase [Bacteroidetes bacterium MedPE-SWsnd-G1]|nr:MAG: glycosyltransferase [Bacteroidetes bacterium MedPE-SWsnd-G1]
MHQKIKILYTIPNFDSAGSGKVVYDMVKFIDKDRFEPHIACFHNQGSLFKKVKELGVPIHIFPFAISYRPFLSFPIRILKLIVFFKKHNFDLIHSWHWSSDFSEPLAAKLSRTSYVYTKKAMSWGNKAWKLRSKLSTKVIYINKDMGTDFFHNMKNKAVYIPLGVDITYFNPQIKVDEPVEYQGITTKDFIIVSVANLVPVKGIEVLLESIQEFNNLNIKVFIVGHNDSEYGDYLKSTFKENNIYFVGKQLDVRPYLAKADLFVIPTKNEGRKEGMPIAPMEAMAMGKIVVGSNISGIKDILNPFPECLFEPNSVDSLMERIQYIMQFSREAKLELQKRMKKEIESNYTLDQFVTNQQEVYFKMMK